VKIKIKYLIVGLLTNRMEDALNLSVLLDFFVTVAASVYFVPQLERG